MASLKSTASSGGTISIFALGCEGLGGAFSTIPDDRILTAKHPCDEVHEEGVLSCKHPGFEDYLTEGKGFSLSTKRLRGFNAPLPRYIPVPDRQSANLFLDMPGVSVLGVRPADLFPRSWRYDSGNLVYKDLQLPDLEYTKRPIFKGKQTIFFGSAQDSLIEGLNRDKDLIELYPALKAAGFMAAVSPDFSVNEGSCYPGQMVNLNRSLAMGERSEAEHVPAIPNIYALDDYQRSEWLQFLENNPGVVYASVNCQCQRKSRADMEVVWLTMRTLIENADRPIHFILHGYPLTSWAMEPIASYGSLLHFAETFPFILGRKYHYQSFDAVEKRLARHHLKTKDLEVRTAMIVETIRARQAFLDDALGKIPQALPAHNFAFNLVPS